MGVVNSRPGVGAVSCTWGVIDVGVAIDPVLEPLRAGVLPANEDAGLVVGVVFTTGALVGIEMVAIGDRGGVV